MLCGHGRATAHSGARLSASLVSAKVGELAGRTADDAWAGQKAGSPTGLELRVPSARTGRPSRPFPRARAGDLWRQARNGRALLSQRRVANCSTGGTGIRQGVVCSCCRDASSLWSWGEQRGRKEGYLGRPRTLDCLLGSARAVRDRAPPPRPAAAEGVSPLPLLPNHPSQSSRHVGPDDLLCPSGRRHFRVLARPRSPAAGASSLVAVFRARPQEEPDGSP